MMSERRGVQLSLYTPSLEEIVKSDEFLRKLDAEVDFSFIYDELRPYYCQDNGRYSTDPVVIVKSLLIAFLYGIVSERRLEFELQYNALYRWFIGVGFDEKVPDHSTISQLRRRKFNDADIFRKLFMRVLELCAEKGLVSGRLLVTDSTHIKANASKTSKIKIEIERQTAEFFEQLDTYEAAERERLGMPEITRKPPEAKMAEQTVSTTDPEAGWLDRPNKPDGFHFLAHETLDAENGIIVDVKVTPGNTPDNIPYIEQIDRATDSLEKLDIEVEAVCADSAYDTTIIHKEMEERGLTIYTPQKDISDHSKTEYKRDDFTYMTGTPTSLAVPVGSGLHCEPFSAPKPEFTANTGPIPKPARIAHTVINVLRRAKNPEKYRLTFFNALLIATMRLMAGRHTIPLCENGRYGARAPLRRKKRGTI